MQWPPIFHKSLPTRGVGAVLLLLAGAAAVCTGCVSMAPTPSGEDPSTDATEGGGSLLADIATVTVGNILWTPYKVTAELLDNWVEIVGSYGDADTKVALLAPVVLPVALALWTVISPVDALTTPPFALKSAEHLEESIDLPFKPGLPGMH